MERRSLREVLFLLTFYDTCSLHTGTGCSRTEWWGCAYFIICDSHDYQPVD